MYIIATRKHKAHIPLVIIIIHIYMYIHNIILHILSIGILWLCSVEALPTVSLHYILIRIRKPAPPTNTGSLLNTAKYVV